MAIGHVANWGNDENDGLTWETAKKSLQGAKDSGLNPINADGFYNEALFHLNGDIIGGNLILDGTGFNDVIHAKTHYKNLTVKNFDFFISSAINGGITNCIIYRCSGDVSPTNYNIISRSLVYKSSISIFTLLSHNIIHGDGESVRFQTFSIDSINNIVSGKQIDIAPTIISNLSYIRYSLFIESSFKFRDGGSGTDETTFEYPTGATDTLKLQNLRDRMVIVYGGLASDYLVGCKYYSGSYNDIFVDADNGDFSLVPNCIAAHMSYDGDYIGARREGVKANWNTDWTNIVNIDSSGRVIDQNLDSSAESNIIDVGHIRRITDFSILGQRAARNGQQLNTEDNLGPQIDPGDPVLTAGLTYQCLNNVITLNDGASTSHEPFNCFVAVDEGSGVGLGFSGTGMLKEVYTDGRYDEKLQMKVSKTDATLASAVTITCYASENPVMVNVDGGGEPTYGAADVGYTIGTAVPLYTRYYKLFIKINSWQLAAR